MSERPPVPTPKDAFGNRPGSTEPLVVEPLDNQMPQAAEFTQGNGHVAESEQSDTNGESNPGLLSAEQRERDTALMDVTDRRNLSDEQRKEMQQFKRDAYMTPGMVFGAYKRAAEARLSRDDEIRNPQPDAPAVAEQSAPKPRALSRANRADLETVANARSRGEASAALNKEDLPKNSPLRKLELSPIDTNRPTSALESLRAVRESAREQLARDDAAKAQLRQARAAVVSARREVAHEKTLVEQREQWKADDAAVKKAEQGILNAWKFKHGGEAGLKHELARKDSDLMERVRRQARVRVGGGDEQSATQPVRSTPAEVILPSATQREENKKTVEGLNKFYRQQLLGTAAGGAPEAKTATRTPEANGRFTNQDFIQFTDREIGLSFSTVGTQIALGVESTHPSAQNFSAEGNNMALIYTDNGVYGLAKGRLISMRTGEATELPQDTVNFSIGDTVMMPGSDKPTEIQEVLLQYKTADEVLQGAEQATRPSPFTKLREKLAENGVAVDPTKVAPVVSTAPAAPQLPALTQQPAAPKAPAPEKRKKGRLFAVAAAGALAVAGIFGGIAANNSGDAPNKEVAATSHSVEDDTTNRSDMSVEKGKTVRIEVERGNGITQEVEQQAEAQGISATPAKLKQMYKDFEDQGRFDKVKGLYEMDNGDYGFANAGKQAFPADLMTDMLEWLRTH